MKPIPVSTLDDEARHLLRRGVCPTCRENRTVPLDDRDSDQCQGCLTEYLPPEHEAR